MKKEDKKRIKDIMQHRDLEENLPVYAKAYINTTYEYNLIHLVLNYYTIKEVEDETAGISGDAYMADVMNQLHTIMYETILSQDMQSDYAKILEQIHSLRKELTERMTLLTAYTDALQLYEYVLNRMEYGLTGEEFEVDATGLATRVFQYLFRENDKMVVNSKIQMVTGQLPVRMTKNRFFEYLTATLNIYNGSSQSSVDDFVEMLESTTLLKLPKGYGKEYPEIAKVIAMLSDMDYKNLTLETYQGMMEQFSLTTERLTGLVSNYLLVTEIVNDLYALILAHPYEDSSELGTQTCLDMLRGLHESFVTGGEIPQVVDEGFMQIEGLQEMLGEDVLQYESVLQEIMINYGDIISGIMAEKIFQSLSLISKLSSNSLFIDLEEDQREDVPADADYIEKKKDALVEKLLDFFAKNSKEINRAVMASMFSNMPVLFNSQQEVKEYIEYSLGHCSNTSELMACAKILEDMMAEE